VNDGGRTDLVGRAGSRGRRWTAGRGAVYLVIVVSLVCGALVAVRSIWRQQSVATMPTWFAPYVDLTLTPHYAFEDPAVNPSLRVVLGFVVADKAEATPTTPPTAPGTAAVRGCTPAWGGVYGLDVAVTALDLDRRVANYRARGGDVVVSFGGAANQELAVTCGDETALAGAYRTVLDRYQGTTIDLDIEAAALDDQAATARRARAVAALQGEAARAGRPLAVWLTLPVTPSGMLDNAIAVIDAMLVAGVDLGGVNLMTMDYGPSRPDTLPMGEAVLRSLTESHRQLGEAYRRAGRPLDSHHLWNKLGATPMIGVNDVLTEVFTPADGTALVDFARHHGLGRVSMWSANRDGPCPGGPDVTRVWNTCSGLAQSPAEFGLVLGRVGGLEPVALPEVTAPVGQVVLDDPATSPYPVWDARQVYEEGDRVVRRQQVYVASWWTQGEDPTVPVEEPVWRHLGSVLASDVPRSTTTLPAGTYPEWDPTIAYHSGDRVLRNGVGYLARWYAEGIDPAGPPTGDGPSPWRAISAD
jgi:chitinase